MPKRYLTITALLVSLLFAAPAHAQGPTTTPEPQYSRSDLLARIAPKPFSITPMFTGIDMPTKIADTTLDGTSWGLTLISILEASGVQTFLLGLVMILMLVFWLRKTLVEKMNKRELSPLETQFKQFNQSVLNPFRKDLNEFRSFNRSSRSSGRSSSRRNRF